MQRQRNEDGMVYRGACDLIHIADGERAEMGAWLAGKLDAEMRRAALANGSRTLAQVYAKKPDAQSLCAGCYMVALFNAAVTLAQENGQSLTELGASMARAFGELAQGGAERIESIHVALDPDDDAPVPDSILAAGRLAEASMWDVMAQAVEKGATV